MNVDVVTMDERAAKRELRAVRKAMKRSAQMAADEEYQQLEEAYLQLAKGRALIDVGQAIRLAPTDEKARPKLAIARADRKQVRMRWDAHSTRCVFDTQFGGGRPGRLLTISIDLERQHGRTMQLRDGHTYGVTVEGHSLVPIVPAPLRVEHRALGLERFHILWEVEQWADRPIRAVPDRDPYLLLHIRADTFAVIAEWDLTPIERMVMAGRRQA